MSEDSKSLGLESEEEIQDYDKQQLQNYLKHREEDNKFDEELQLIIQKNININQFKRLHSDEFSFKNKMGQFRNRSSAYMHKLGSILSHLKKSNAN